MYYNYLVHLNIYCIMINRDHGRREEYAKMVESFRNQNNNENTETTETKE